MHSLTLHVRTQFRTQRLVRHEVDRTSQQILEEELDAEVACRGGRSVERDEDVHVTAFSSCVAHDGAEYRQIGDTVPSCQLSLARCKRSNHVYASQHSGVVPVSHSSGLSSVAPLATSARCRTAPANSSAPSATKSVCR